MKNSGKEFGLPLNLDIKNKLSLQSNASKGPPSPKQPFFIGNYFFLLIFIIIIIIVNLYIYIFFGKNLIFFSSGVAGGTASGKTTVCNLINTQLHDQRIVLINQVINSQ
jgi:hypothetical protein